jgi:hypothetical protein
MAQARSRSGPCYACGPGGPACQGVVCPPGTVCETFALNSGGHTPHCTPVTTCC